MRPIKPSGADSAAAVRTGAKNANDFSKNILDSQRGAAGSIRGPKPRLYKLRKLRAWKENEERVTAIERRLNHRIDDSRETITNLTIDLNTAVAELGVHAAMHDAQTLVRTEFLSKIKHAMVHANAELIACESAVLDGLGDYRAMLNSKVEEDTLDQTEADGRHDHYKAMLVSRMDEIESDINASFDRTRRQALGSTSGMFT